MKKIYTMFYRINGFDDRPEDFIDADVLFGKGFEEVFDFLNKHELKVDNRIIKDLLAFAKSQEKK